MLVVICAVENHLYNHRIVKVKPAKTPKPHDIHELDPAIIARKENETNTRTQTHKTQHGQVYFLATTTTTKEEFACTTARLALVEPLIQ
jgi:hypothetical protein